MIELHRQYANLQAKNWVNADPMIENSFKWKIKAFPFNFSHFFKRNNVYSLAYCVSLIHSFTIVPFSRQM